MKNELETCWTSLAAFLMVLLFVGASDGLMEAFGPIGFSVIGAAVMSAAWAFSSSKRKEKKL